MYLLADKHLLPFYVLQVDENAPQQQQQSSSTSSVTVTTPDDNGSLSATTTAITTKNDDRASPVNHHTLRKEKRRGKNIDQKDLYSIFICIFLLTSIVYNKFKLFRYNH